ncbi:MAG: tyrosine-type recombinase/integrase [Candidatus Gastranaerophilaceae bacterium]
MDKINNKNMIEKIAKKLDKFTFDEIVTISELEENEVKEILEVLIQENAILQKEDTYFYTKIKNKQTVKRKTELFQEFILEEQDGYEEYLRLSPCYKKTVDKRINIIKLTNGFSGKDLKSVIDLYNAQHSNDTIGYSTVTMLQLQFENYGLRGLFPKIRGQKNTKTPQIIYDTFKKYYLNKNKFSSEIALKLAQTELQNSHKIDSPLVFNAKVFYARLTKELGKPTIEHLRNTAEFVVPNGSESTVNTEQINITFKEAAENYFKQLSLEKKQERLLNYKTSYKNHIAYYFDNYTINEIDKEVLKKYKQEKYNSGYSVSAVKNYLGVVKNIITHACPSKDKIVKQIEFLTAIDMNILEKAQIEKMLSIAKAHFSWGYPIIRLALLTGANVPEILALQWKNIFLTDKKIYITQFLHAGKIVKHRVNTSFRYLTIDDETTKIIAELFLKDIPSKEEFVFQIEGIEDLQKYFEETVLTPINKKLALDEFNSSDLIHNFVNMLLTQNVPISYIRKVCGYSSIKTFLDIYNARLEEGEKEYYNPLDIK